MAGVRIAREKAWSAMLADVFPEEKTRLLWLGVYFTRKRIGFDSLARIFRKKG